MRPSICFLLLLSVLQTALPSPLQPLMLCAVDADGSGMRHVHLDSLPAHSHHGRHSRHRHGHSHGHGHQEEGADAGLPRCKCLRSSQDHDADAAWLPDLTVDVRGDVENVPSEKSLPGEDFWRLHLSECAAAFPADHRRSSVHSNPPLCLRL